MGTKTSVSVITVKLVEDQPTPLKDAITRAVFRDEDITKAAIKSQATLFNRSVEKYWKYGKEEFTNGLPEGSLSSGYANTAAVTQVVESFEGEPVTVSYAYIGTLEIDFLAYEYLVENQSFDPDTGIVHSPDFSTSDVVTYNSSIFESDTEIAIYLNVNDGNNTIVKRVYTIPNLSINDAYYMVMYVLDSSPLDVQYWTYNTTLATYPILNENLPDAAESAYYPIVPIRTNKINLSDTTGELKDTSKKMLKYLTVDLDTITDNISDNPDIDLIDDVYLMFALNIQTSNQYGMAYLHKFFYDLSFRSKTNKQMFESWNNDDTYPYTKSVVNISDGEAKIQLEYNYIDINTVTGNIGSIGSVTKETVINDRLDFGSGNLFLSSLTPIEDSYLIFRKQISSTEYSEVKIHGLTHTSWVYKSKTVVRTLADSLVGEDDDAGFYIPVNRTTLKDTFDDNQNESEVLYDSMVIVIHAVQKTKLKWYQTGLFKALVVVVVIVIAIVFAQPQIALLLQQTSLSAAAWLAVELAVEAIITGLAIDYTVAFLIEQVGGEAVLILAAVATIVALASGRISGLPNLPWADQLLDASTATLQGVQNYVSDEMQELSDEMDNLMASTEDVQEQIDNSQAMLDTSKLDPLIIVDRSREFVANETPYDFYQRTIHNTNPGVLSLDMINKYHEGALSLPEPNDLLAMNMR